MASGRPSGPAIVLVVALLAALSPIGVIPPDVGSPIAVGSARAAAPPPFQPGPASPSPAQALPAWDGSVDLYREGTFTTQQSWLWCTAAGVQIARNIVHDEIDHARSGQARYFDWMRARNRYDLPVSAGVDPQGWEAGLRHFVDDRYRLMVSASFDGAVRLAVERIRRTGLPVALTVANGGHGWLLTGFSATADPATTDDFAVTSVRVVGPLWGLQSRGGYDMPPNTSLTLEELRRFFTPWRYDPLPMAWDGRYVSIQPVPSASAAGVGRVSVEALPVLPVPWNAPRAV